MRESGFELLLNSEKKIRLLDNSEISIFGLDDILLGKPKIKETLQRARKTLITLFLFTNQILHRKSLTIQLTYSFLVIVMADKYKFLLGAIITPALAKNYVEGFYTIQDLALYVNRGLGRTRVPSDLCQNLKLRFSRSNIRNHSPIFLTYPFLYALIHVSFTI